MKNFRKVLALILVVATLFSFVAMASAKTSKDYSDADKIQYVEAVDVLSAVGILKGYNGAYHPTDDVGRDEMAKMIAVLRNGAVDNSALFTGANTFADCKGSWAEGYIAYAAQVGIINGRNATTFDPEGKVTGTEVMKMLLCVLGYDAKLQGYVGSNWQVNVLRDATKMGLMDGMDKFDPYKAATRDESAQLMYNALKAKMVVGYVSENIVKVTNSLYKFPTSITTPDAKKNGYEFAYCNAVLSDVPLWTIIDGLDYVKGTSADCFGRPGHKWTYTVDKKEVFSCFYADAYKAKQTEGDFDDDLMTYKDDNGKKIRKTVYKDGYKVADDTMTDTAYAAAIDAITTGNGVLVEYYDEVVVVINSYVAKVGKVSEYYNYFTLVDDEGKQLAKFDLNDYEVKADDIVLYHTCNGSLEGDDKNDSADNKNIILHDLKVITAEKVEVTEGVNYKDWNTSYIVASGKTYKYAALLGYVLDAGKNMDRLVWKDIKDNGKVYDLYFDEYGYIKYYKVHTEDTEYTYTYIVEGSLAAHDHGWTIDKDGNKIPDVTRTATLVNYGKDGALTPTTEVTVAENVQKALRANGKLNSIGVLAKTFVNDDKETEIEDVAEFAKEGTELSANKFTLKEKDVYATSETVFMIRTKNLDGTYSYEQVTGYKNLKGSYVAKDFTAKTEDGETVVLTNIQFFRNADHPAFASYVFIDAVYTHDFDTTFITLEQAKYESFQTKLEELYADDFVAYVALVEGKEALVLVDRKAGTTADQPLLKVATKYEASLSYLGVAVTNDAGAKDLPIYAVVDESAKVVGDVVVGCHYEVAEKEAYIWFKADVKVNGKTIAEAGKVYKFAEDAVVLTLTANKVDGELVADVYEGLLELENGGDIEYCYVTINDDGEVTELIRIDNQFIEANK